MEIASPNSGAFILDQLQRFGSDLNRTHDFSFWLYFPSEESALKAVHHSEASGFKTEVLPPLRSAHDSRWLCLLYCPHIPDESLLNGISRFCTQLASEFNGIYDGWESRLELPNGANMLR